MSSLAPKVLMLFVSSIRENRYGLSDAILGRAVARMPGFRMHSFIGEDETHLKLSDPDFRAIDSNLRKSTM